MTEDLPLSYSHKHPLCAGVLISGGGSTLENLLVRIADGRLRNVRVAGVISSRHGIRGNQVAADAELPLRIIRPRDFPTLEEFSAAIEGALAEFGAELAVLGGFLCHWKLSPAFEGRAINIHPALLPRFGGRGMYGHHVHEAVLAAGERFSGCTVHLVDQHYDHGPIIAQRRVPVLPSDSPDALAARVMAAERELLPEILQAAADSGLGWMRALAEV